MKINKDYKVLIEDAESTQPAEVEVDLAIDDVQDASTDEIADAVQVAAVAASDGEETFSDSKAEKVATEIKTAARGLDHTAWAPLDVRSELTDMLDLCLARSMIAKKSKRKDGVDLIVTGLPGSGKTGITSAWADARNVNLFYLNAKNRELDAILNGFPVDTVETTDGGKQIHKVIKSRSTILDPLEEPNSILFLDEFNRAPEDLRAVLLTLINEHEIEGEGKKGKYRFENLLFTVACVNPSVPTDPGAMELNDAEKSRYLIHMDWDSNVKDALNYILWYIRDRIDALDKNDPDYTFLYMDLQKTYNLAKQILKHRKFKFDTRQDLGELSEKGANMLNQRSLTDGIMGMGNSKQQFLMWVDRFSGYLEKNKIMFHEILDSWTEPTVAPPTDGKAPVMDDAGGTDNSTDNSKNSDTFNDSDDFNSIFGNDGTESDSGLFGSTVSTGGTISASDATKRLNDFDFTL